MIVAPLRLPLNDEGVSVIVGTLLLILITVTAAGGLAIMVSEFQKTEMERQSHIRNVENEELRLLEIDLENNQTFWLDWSNSTITHSTNWSTLDLDILNMNVEDSYITAVSVNGRYAANYTSGGTVYDLKKRLLVPATKTGRIHLNFTDNFAEPLFISEEESIHIRAVTSFYNIFDRTYKSPTPIIRFRIDTENLLVADRGVLVLDGSDSFDDGAVTDWTWTLTDASGTFPAAGNWTDAGNLTTAEYPGKNARIRFETTGPFRVTLAVTDDAGMRGLSSPIDIPANPSYNPPVNLLVRYDPPGINASVLDIGGKPVAGVPVSFVKLSDAYGNLTLSSWSGVTGANGYLESMVVEGKGTVSVISGMLPRAYISV
jgi:flagellin-like protein